MSDCPAAVPSPPAPHPADPSRPTARPGTGRTLLLSAALSLCLTAAGLTLYDLTFAQKLVVFDMGAFLNEQRALLVAGKTEESDRRFNDLEAWLTRLPANRVVLLKSVAVRNAIEIRP